MNFDFPVRIELSQTWRQLFAAATALLLILMAFYPPGYDQAVFAVGGNQVLHGAIPYRDFLDTKPPAIFYIYAFAELIFGHHMWAHRVLDLLYYAVSSFLLYRFLIFGRMSKDLALLSVFILIAHYVSNGFWMTTQAESFAVLPSLGICAIMLRQLRATDRSLLLDSLFVGSLTMILFLLKFTLVLAPAAALLFLLVYGQYKRRALLLTAGSAAVFAVLLALFLYWLSAVGALTPFFQGIDWVRKYADLDPLFAKVTISKLYYQFFPMQFLFFVSPLFFLALLAALYHYFRSDDENALYPLLLFQIVAGLLTVIYERKFFGYHFMRLDWALAPFIAIGLLLLMQLVKDLWQRAKLRLPIERLFLQGVYVITILVVLFYSPFARMTNQSFRWIVLQLIGGNIGAEVQRRDNQFYLAEQMETGAWLKNHLAPGQSIFVWGNGVSIYWYAEQRPTTIVLTNTPLVTTWTPDVWKARALTQLSSQLPDYFVVEWGDDREYITGNTRDSYQNMVKWDDLNQLRIKHYQEVERIGHYIIYQRSQTHPQ